VNKRLCFLSVASTRPDSIETDIAISVYLKDVSSGIPYRLRIYVYARFTPKDNTLYMDVYSCGC